MKNSFLAIVIFAFFCNACVGAQTYQTPVRLAEGLDPASDVMESECSYFYFMWGRTAELEDKLEEAREAYEKALVCDLHAVHVMHRLAVLLINMGKKETAAGWIQEIIDENPEDMSSYALLANLYVSMEEFEEAEKIYLGILDKNPKDLDNMLLLGALYARQKKFDDARATLQKVIKLNPESSVGYHYLAKIFMETGKFEKAQSSYEKALEVNWSPFLAFEAAFFLTKRGLYDDALKLYQQIIAEDDSDERVRTMAISLLLKMDRIDEAIVELEKLLHIAEDTLKVEMNLSRLLLDRERYDEAIVHLNNILAIDPDLIGARILLAVAHHDKGGVALAISSLQEINYQSADFENATIFLARIYIDEKKPESAISMLRERISDEKTRHGSFYTALAAILKDQRKNDEAATVFQEALTLYPTNKDLFLEYAMFQDEQKDVEGALASMEKVLTINHDEPYALNYLAYTWAERGEKLEKALEYVKKALELQPDDGFIRDSFGWVLFKMGRFDEALKELKKSYTIMIQNNT